jgi:hypothetical protein
MRERLEIKKDLLVYLLGFVPILDIPFKIFEGFGLVSRKMKSFKQEDKYHCIYFDANKWRTDYQDKINSKNREISMVNDNEWK